MDFKDIAIQNPWWEKSFSMEDDFHIQSAHHKPYTFKRSIIHELEFQSGNIHVLRGPRQVGKTTLIKELISRLIDEKKERNQILYLSCEAIEHFEILRDVLKNYLSDHSTLSYVFLDEISFIPEWQRAILWLFNTGLLKSSCLVLTGSNARDLKESAERLPGRRGEVGNDIQLYPLSLTEYSSLSCFSKYSPTELWKIYRMVGGFPHAIRDFNEHGIVTDQTFLTYRNWIVTDAARFNLSENILKHILFRIYETLSSQMTWPKLIENTPIRSHETALEYIEHLEDAFLCQVLHCYDPNKKGPALQKSRKLYFIDPLLYFVSIAWHNGIGDIYRYATRLIEDPSFEGKLLESMWVNHFKRLPNPTYFWYSSSTKQEVDIVVVKNQRMHLYDVKRSHSVVADVMKQSVECLSIPTQITRT